MVADIGVPAAMPRRARPLVAHIEAVPAEGGLDVAAIDRLAAAIEAFGAAARHELPRADDDIDELEEWSA